MRPTWYIHRVEGGHVVAWRDAAGAYADFTKDEPMRLWYAMYRAYKARTGWRLALLRQLHPDDTQDMYRVDLTETKEVAGV
ncbi:MAG: hypothetical protein ACPG7F_00525 [Aggregatilineales bacterium]